MLTFLLCCLPPAEMEAQNRQQGFTDPLSAAVEESERAPPNRPDAPAALEASGSKASPASTLNMKRLAADGSEDVEKDAVYDKNDGTDSSTTWSPEVLHTL